MRYLRRKTRWLPAVLLLFSILLFRGCDHSYLDAPDNMKPYTYNPVFALPLVNSSLTISDILDVDSLNAIYVDEENLIWLIYKGRVFSLPARDFITIGNQSGNFSASVDPSKTNTKQSVEHTFTFDFFNDAQPTSIKFLLGTFQASLSAPELQSDGFTLSSSFEILNSVDASSGEKISGTVGLNTPANVSLTGSTLNFESNGLTIRHTITISGAGNPVNAPYNVDFQYYFNSLSYDIIEGYIGQIPFPIGNTSINLGIFDNTEIGDFFFEAPRIEIFASNSYGAPIDVLFNNFFAVNKQGESIDLSGSGFHNPWRVNQSTQPGEIIVSHTVIDRSGANLDQIIQISPTEFYYDVSGLTNPAGSALNFVKHNSNLNIDVEVFLPFHGRIDKLIIEDTLSQSFSDIPDELEWMEMNLNITNGFPLDIAVQVYFASENMILLDSLFMTTDQQNIFKAAATNPATQAVNTPSFRNTKVMFDPAKITNIKETENFIIKASILTYNQSVPESVKILESYKIDFQMGVRAKAKRIVDFEDNDE